MSEATSEEATAVSVPPLGTIFLNLLAKAKQEDVDKLADYCIKILLNPPKDIHEISTFATNLKLQQEGIEIPKFGGKMFADFIFQNFAQAPKIGAGEEQILDAICSIMCHCSLDYQYKHIDVPTGKNGQKSKIKRNPEEQ